MEALRMLKRRLDTTQRLSERAERFDWIGLLQPELAPA
jgi:hypothetical protein